MKNQRVSLSKSSSSILLGAKFIIPAFCLASSLAQGQANYTSSGSGDWNNAATWGGGGFPANSSADTGNIAPGHTVTLTASTDVGALRFTSGGAPRTIAGAFNLTATGTQSATWNSGTGLLITFDAVNFTLNNNSQTISVSGASSRVYEVNNSASITVADGAMAFTMSGPIGTTKTFDATSGTGSFAVGSSGILQLAATGVIGNYVVFADDVSFSMAAGGAMNLPVSGGFNIQSTTASLAGAINYTTGGSGDVRYTGSGTLTIGSSLAVSNDGGGGTDTFDHRSGTLSFGSTTTLTLGTQVLTVSGGTVNGTANLGSSSGTIAITAANSAVNIQPGGAGTLGSLNLNTIGLDFTGVANTKTLTIDLNSTGANSSDTLSFGAATAIGNVTLAINNTGGTYELTPISIITAASGLGSFANVADGGTLSSGGVDFTVDITATEVTLTPVPEPEHYLGAVGLGLIGFAAFRRSQLKRKA